MDADQFFAIYFALPVGSVEFAAMERCVIVGLEIKFAIIVDRLHRLDE